MKSTSANWLENYEYGNMQTRAKMLTKKQKSMQSTSESRPVDRYSASENWNNLGMLKTAAVAQTHVVLT